jgi:hypothetical protein
MLAAADVVGVAAPAPLQAVAASATPRTASTRVQLRLAAHTSFVVTPIMGGLTFL